MGTHEKDEKSLFLERNHIDELYGKAQEIDKNLWSNLQEIRNAYEKYSDNLYSAAQRLLNKILSDKELKDIHSAKYRVKDTNSLLVKIVKKKSTVPKEVTSDYDIEKYRNLKKDNYYKILTDLIGVRILIRYREQWLLVHKWIKDNFYQGDKKYIKNFENDYVSRPDEAFIAEKPKVYYRNREDLSFYRQIGKDFFDFIESDEGYNSMHYIINNDGKYIEIQVRTIFDEAWSECTHDLVYKSKDKSLKPELSYLSRCLAYQTMSAESIANLMYEKVNGNSVLFENVSNLTDSPTFGETIVKSCPNIQNSSIKNRINILNKYETIFDGSLDSLI